MNTLHKSLFYALVAASLSFNAQAAVQSYNIDVAVTAAPASPGSYGTINPWSFGSLPQVFSGSFNADNASIGAVSNFVLSVGGLDIWTTHSNVPYNSFDPFTLTLALGQYDSGGCCSFVSFGTTPFGSPPSNYAVAVENNYAAPLDPFLGYTQNWVGTYTVTAVPEPETYAMLLSGLGLLGFMVRRRKSIMA